jgi:D-alanine-D-alanine ligase
MDQKVKITVLYDAAEDIEKAKAEAAGKPFPLAYAQVADALEKRGHKVQTVAVTKKIRNLVALVEKDNSDVIFNLCEAIASSTQHEHNVVGLLELFEKCFTGCGSEGWLLASDKALCKKIFQFHGIRYPRFCTFEQGKVEWADALDFPMIVKPLNEDASIGIDAGSVVHNVKELLERISYIHEEFQGASLVEEYIEGREIYVGVLGNDKPEAFPIIEWDFSKLKDIPKIAGTEAKWDPESEAYKAPEVFPEDIPKEVVEGIQNTAITAYQALELSGYARVDMRLRRRKKSEVAKNRSDKGGKKTDDATSAAKSESTVPRHQTSAHSPEWDYPIIEVNPNCWLEKRSQFAVAGRKHGHSYPDLLERIIELAIARRPTAAT